MNMILNEYDEVMTTASDRYARATISANLKQSVERDPLSDVDVIIAAGWVRDSLACSLFRLRVEFDRIDKRALLRHVRVSLKDEKSKAEVQRVTLAALSAVPSYTPTLDALEKFMRAQANRLDFELSPSRASHLARRVLELFLDPTCPQCQGLGYEVIKGTTHLSDIVCETCFATGKRDVFITGDSPSKRERYLVSLIQANIERKIDRFSNLIDRLVKGGSTGTPLTEEGRRLLDKNSVPQPRRKKQQP